MFLALKSTIPLPKSKSGEQTSIVKALKKGMGIPETSVIFMLSAAGAPGWGQDKGLGVRCGTGALDGEIEGDVFTVKAECLDVALWKIGGAAVVLRLVQLATVSCFHYVNLQRLLRTSVSARPRTRFLVRLGY